ncbi:MAG: ECF transporter S component [Bacillota bacterium]|nr:ECF transporter S component [Bacillota bacterium]
MSNAKNSLKIRRMVYAAICVALALVLPFLTGQIPQVGKMLCPMHIPALLCGFMCGPVWGLVVGLVSPILRSLIFGMPVMFPTAVSMAFELAAYGWLTGILYKHLPKKAGYIYLELILAMMAGRVVAGATMYFLMMAKGQAYTMTAFITTNFVTAVPGIILQVIVIPVIVMALKKAKLI